MKLQSATAWSIVRAIAPPKFLSGIGSTVRSGLNFPAASFRAAFRPFVPPSSITATDLAGESANACSAARRSSSSTMARIAAWPGLRFWPSPPSMPPTILFLANLPTSAPAAAPTATEASSGGAKRPTSRPTPPPQPMPFAAEVVAGLADAQLALLVLLDQDHAVGLDLLVLHQLRELIEVLFGRLSSHVSGHDDDVLVVLAHFDSPCRYGSTRQFQGPLAQRCPHSWEMKRALRAWSDHAGRSGTATTKPSSARCRPQPDMLWRRRANPWATITRGAASAVSRQ